MAEILALVSKIILIIAGGMDAIEATMKVARDGKIDFDTLFKFIPNKWK